MPALGFTSTQPDGYVSFDAQPIGVIQIVVPVGYLVFINKYLAGAAVDVDSGSESQPQYGQ